MVLFQFHAIPGVGKFLERIPFCRSALLIIQIERSCKVAVLVLLLIIADDLRQYDCCTDHSMVNITVIQIIIGCRTAADSDIIVQPVSILHSFGFIAAVRIIRVIARQAICRTSAKICDRSCFMVRHKALIFN